MILVFILLFVFPIHFSYSEKVIFELFTSIKTQTIYTQSLVEINDIKSFSNNLDLPYSHKVSLISMNVSHFGEQDYKNAFNFENPFSFYFMEEKESQNKILGFLRDYRNADETKKEVVKFVTKNMVAIMNTWINYKERNNNKKIEEISMKDIFDKSLNDGKCKSNFKEKEKGNRIIQTVSVDFPDGCRLESKKKDFFESNKHSYRSNAYYYKDTLSLEKVIRKYDLFLSTNQMMRVKEKLKIVSSNSIATEIDVDANNIITFQYDEEMSEYFFKNNERRFIEYTDSELSDLLRYPFDTFTSQYNITKSFESLIYEEDTRVEILDYICRLVSKEVENTFFEDHHLFFLQHIARLSSKIDEAEEFVKYCIIENRDVELSLRKFGINYLVISFENLEFLFGLKDEEDIQRELLWHFGQNVKFLVEHQTNETIIDEVMNYLHDNLKLQDGSSSKIWLEALESANQEDSIDIIIDNYNSKPEDKIVERLTVVALSQFMDYKKASNGLESFLDNENRQIRILAFTGLLKDDDNLQVLISHLNEEDLITRRKMIFILEKTGHYFSKNPNIIEKNVCTFEESRRSTMELVDIFEKKEFEEYDYHFELGFCEKMKKNFGTDDFGAYYDISLCNEGGIAFDTTEVSFPVFYVHVDNHFTIALVMFGVDINIVDIGFKLDFDTREILVDSTVYRRALTHSKQNSLWKNTPFLQIRRSDFEKNEDYLDTMIKSPLWKNIEYLSSILELLSTKGISTFSTVNEFNLFLKANSFYKSDSEVDFSFLSRYDYEAVKLTRSEIFSRSDTVLFVQYSSYSIGTKNNIPNDLQYAIGINTISDDFEDNCMDGWNLYGDSYLCTKNSLDSFLIDNMETEYELDDNYYDCENDLPYRQIEEKTKFTFLDTDVSAMGGFFHFTLPSFLSKSVGLGEFQQCASNLEICYNDCPNVKETCDEKFTNCLDEVCEKKSDFSVEKYACNMVRSLFNETVIEGPTDMLFTRAKNLHCKCMSSIDFLNYETFDIDGLSTMFQTSYGCNNINDIDYLPPHIKHNFVNFCLTNEISTDQRIALYSGLKSEIYFSSSEKFEMKNFVDNYEENIKELFKDTFLEDFETELETFEEKYNYLLSISTDIFKEYNEKVQKLEFLKSVYRLTFEKNYMETFKKILMDSYLGRNDGKDCDKAPQKIYNWLVRSFELAPPSYINYITEKFQKCTQESNNLKIVNQYWFEVNYVKCNRIGTRCLWEHVHINERDSILRMLLGEELLPDTEIAEEIEIDLRQPIEGEYYIIGKDDEEDEEEEEEEEDNGKFTLWGQETSIPLSIVTLDLGIEVYIDIDVKLGVSFELYKMFLDAHLIPSAALKVDLTAEISLFFIKAGVKGEITILGGEIDIGAGFWFNSLPFELDINAEMTMEALSYDVDAVITVRDRIKTCWGFPCGLEWGSEKSWDLYDGTIFNGGVIHLISTNKKTVSNLRPNAVSSSIEVFENEVVRTTLKGSDEDPNTLVFYTDINDQVSDLYYCSDYILDSSTGEITIVTPKYFSGICQINFRVKDDDYFSEGFGSLQVTVKPIATEPLLKVQSNNIVVREDEEISFSFSTHLVDRDGSENFEKIWLSDMPENLVVKKNEDTEVTITSSGEMVLGEDMNKSIKDKTYNIYIKMPKDNFYGDKNSYWGFDVTINSRVTENSTTSPEYLSVEVSETIHVDVIPVNDPPILILKTEPQDLSNFEELDIYHFNAEVVDVDIFDFLMSCHIEVQHGILSIDESVIDLTEGSKNHDKSIKFKGTLYEVNSVLFDIKYTAGYNENGFGYNGLESMNITCCDGGSFGEGTSGELSTIYPRFDESNTVSYCSNQFLSWTIKKVNERPQIMSLPRDLRTVETNNVTFTIYAVDDSKDLSIEFKSETGIMNITKPEGWSETDNNGYFIKISGSNEETLEKKIPILITYTPVVEVCAQRIEITISDGVFSNDYVQFIERASQYSVGSGDDYHCEECNKYEDTRRNSGAYITFNFPANKTLLECLYIDECEKMDFSFQLNDFSPRLYGGSYSSVQIWVDPYNAGKISFPFCENMQNNNDLFCIIDNNAGLLLLQGRNYHQLDLIGPHDFSFTPALFYDGDVEVNVQLIHEDIVKGNFLVKKSDYIPVVASLKNVYGPTEEDEEISIKIQIDHKDDIGQGYCKLIPTENEVGCTFDFEISPVDGKVKLVGSAGALYGSIDWQDRISMQGVSYLQLQNVMKDFKYIYTGEIECFTAINITITDNYYLIDHPNGPTNIFRDSKYEPKVIWVAINRVNDPPLFVFNGEEKNACSAVSFEGDEETEIPLAGFSIKDVDQFKKPGTLYLTPMNGVLKSGNLTNLITTKVQAKSNEEWELTGKLDDLNNFLETLTFIGDTYFFGDTYVSMRFIDNGSISEDQTIYEVQQWIDLKIKNTPDNPKIYTPKRIFVNEGFRKDINDEGEYNENWGKTPSLASFYDPDLNSEIFITFECIKCYWMVELSDNYCTHYNNDYNKMNCTGSVEKLNDLFKDLLLYEPIGKGDEQIAINAYSPTSPKLEIIETIPGFEQFENSIYKTTASYVESFEAGESFCNSLTPKCHLASIQSEGENVFLKNILVNKGWGAAWIGYKSYCETSDCIMFESDNTNVMDGTNFIYKNFENRPQKDENYAFLRSSGAWDAMNSVKIGAICKHHYESSSIIVPVWINPVADPVVIETVDTIFVDRSSDDQIVDLSSNISFKVDNGYGWAHATDSEDKTQSITKVRFTLGENLWTSTLDSHISPLHFEGGYKLSKHEYEYIDPEGKFNLIIPAFTYGSFEFVVTVFSVETLNNVETRSKATFYINIDGELPPHLQKTKDLFTGTEGQILHIEPPPFKITNQVYRSDLICCIEATNAKVSIERRSFQKKSCESAYHDYSKISISPDDYFNGDSTLSVECHNSLGSYSITHRLHFLPVHSDIELKLVGEMDTKKYLKIIKQNSLALLPPFEVIDHDNNQQFLISLDVTGGFFSFDYNLRYIEGGNYWIKPNRVVFPIYAASVSFILRNIRVHTEQGKRGDMEFRVSVSDSVTEVSLNYLLYSERVNIKPELKVSTNSSGAISNCSAIIPVALGLFDDEPSSFEEKWNILPELTLSWEYDIIVKITSEILPSVNVIKNSTSSITLKGKQSDVINSVKELRVEHLNCKGRFVDESKYITFVYDDKEILNTTDNSLKSDPQNLELRFLIENIYSSSVVLRNEVKSRTYTHNGLISNYTISLSDYFDVDWSSYNDKHNKNFEFSVIKTDTNCIDSSNNGFLNSYDNTFGKTIYSDDFYFFRFYLGREYYCFKQFPCSNYLNETGKCTTTELRLTSTLYSGAVGIYDFEITVCIVGESRRSISECNETNSNYTEKIIQVGTWSIYNLTNEFPKLKGEDGDYLIMKTKDEGLGGSVNSEITHIIKNSGMSGGEIDDYLMNFNYSAGLFDGIQTVNVIVGSETKCTSLYIHFHQVVSIVKPTLVSVSTHHLVESEGEEVDIQIEWNNEVGEKNLIINNVPEGILITSDKEHHVCHSVEKCNFTFSVGDEAKFFVRAMDGEWNGEKIADLMIYAEIIHEKTMEKEISEGIEMDLYIYPDVGEVSVREIQDIDLLENVDHLHEIILNEYIHVYQKDTNEELSVWINPKKGEILEKVKINEMYNVTEEYLNGEAVILDIGERFFGNFIMNVKVETLELYNLAKKSDTLEVFVSVSPVFSEIVFTKQPENYTKINKGESFDISFDYAVIGEDQELHFDVSGLEFVESINGVNVTEFSHSVFDFIGCGNGEKSLNFHLDKLYYGSFYLTFEIYTYELELGFSESTFFESYIEVLPVYTKPIIISEADSVELIGNNHKRIDVQVYNEDDLDGLKCSSHYTLVVLTSHHFTEDGKANLLVNNDFYFVEEYVSLNEVNNALKEMTFWCESTDYQDGYLEIYLSDGGCSGAVDGVDETSVTKRIYTTCEAVNHQGILVNSTTEEENDFFYKLMEGEFTDSEMSISDVDKSSNEYTFVIECEKCRFRVNETNILYKKVTFSGNFIEMNKYLEDLKIGAVNYYNGVTSFRVSLWDLGGDDIGSETYFKSYVIGMNVLPTKTHPSIIGDEYYDLFIERRYDSESYKHLDFFSFEDWKPEEEARLMTVLIKCNNCSFEGNEENSLGIYKEGENSITLSSSKKTINAALKHIKYIPDWYKNGEVKDEIIAKIVMFDGQLYYDIEKTVANVTLSCKGSCCEETKCLTCDEDGFCNSCESGYYVNTYSQCIANVVLPPGAIVGIVVGSVLIVTLFVVLVFLLMMIIICGIYFFKMKVRVNPKEDNPKEKELKEMDFSKKDEEIKEKPLSTEKKTEEKELEMKEISHKEPQIEMKDKKESEK